MEFEKVKTNIRGTWKVLNKILNRNRDNTTNKLEILSDINNILNTRRDTVNECKNSLKNLDQIYSHKC